MRTNIVLDDDLIKEAARLSGIRTKKDLVHEALRVFIAAKRRKSLLDLAGKIEFAPGYDYKALRQDRAPAAIQDSVHEPRPATRRRRRARPDDAASGTSAAPDATKTPKIPKTPETPESDRGGSDS
jgi:Bacterial antitoxin of type II TA system, VapB